MSRQSESSRRAAHEDDLVLLRIRCRRAEADAIRKAARQDRRGISQFVVQVLLAHIGKTRLVSSSTEDTALKALAKIK